MVSLGMLTLVAYLRQTVESVPYSLACLGLFLTSERRQNRRDPPNVLYAECLYAA